MSEVLQSGRHPDADQLSAFVEQALPAHEREATLAHLAVCAECRAVVALSQAAAEPLATSVDKPARKVWFGGWNLAWSAVAVVAALLIVAVYVHHKTTMRSGAGQQTEIAVARPPEPIVQAEHPQKQATAPSTPAARNAPHPASREPREMQRNSVVAEQLHQKQTNELSAARKQNAAGGGAGGSMGVLGGKGVNRQSVVVQPSRQTQALSLAEKAPLNSPASPAPSMNGFSGIAGSDRLQATAAPPAPVFDANQASNELLRAPVPVHPLPNGLPVLSVAVHGRDIVAIDTAHVLFLSNDEGVHWRRIEVPWEGHAVKVSVISSPVHSAARAQSGFGAVFSASQNAGELKSAEATATLKGAITDQTGAVIPGAVVVVTRAANHFSVTVSTDREGRYTASDLAPGMYDVEVRATGFEVGRVSALMVAPSRQNVANLTLTVGAASEAVMVTAANSDKSATGTSGAKTRKATPPSRTEATVPVAAAAPSVFEITMQDGSRWSSADGISWKPE